MTTPTLAEVYAAAKARAEQAPGFEQVHEVVALARKLALENFYLHLAAVTQAHDESAKDAAVARLLKSTEAVAMTSEAYKSFVASESDFAHSTARVIADDMPAARAAAKASGEHMEIVADRLDRFADYVPKSHFFAGALHAVAKADELAGRVEASAAKTVEGFARGLKAFAKKVSDFGRSLAELPEKVSAAVKTHAVSTANAAIVIGSAFMDRLRALADRVVQKVDAGKAKVVQEVVAVGDKVTATRSLVERTAWESLDRAADFVDRVGSHVARATSTVSLHATAAAGVAAGVAGAIGRAVADSYADNLDRVRAQRGLPTAILGDLLEGQLSAEEPAMRSSNGQGGFLIRGFADGAILEERTSGSAVRVFSGKELAALQPSTADARTVEATLSRCVLLEARLKDVLDQLTADNPSQELLHSRLKVADFGTNTPENGAQERLGHLRERLGFEPGGDAATPYAFERSSA
jgi:hypothetical protein